MLHARFLPSSASKRERAAKRFADARTPDLVSACRVPRARRGIAAHRLDQCVHRSTAGGAGRPCSKFSASAPIPATPPAPGSAAAAHRFRACPARPRMCWCSKPDVVVAGSFTKRATRELLKETGLRVVDVRRRAFARRGEGANPPDGRLDAASRPRRGRDQRARCRDRACARSRGAQAAIACCRSRGAAGCPAADSLIEFAGGGSRALATPQAISAEARRICLARSHHQPAAGFHPGVKRQRFCRGRRPRLPAASGAGALLSALEAARRPGAVDGVRRPDGGRMRWTASSAELERVDHARQQRVTCCRGATRSSLS